MSRRGRPRREGAVVVNVKLALYPGEDDDLLDFFAVVPPRGRASAVKGAMRSGNIDPGAQDTTDEDDILDAFEGMLI